MTLLSHSKTCNVGCWCSYTIILGMTGFEITCLLYVPSHLSSTKMIHKTVSKLCSYDRCRPDHCSTSSYIFLRKHAHLVIHAGHRNFKHAPHRTILTPMRVKRKQAIFSCIGLQAWGVAQEYMGREGVSLRANKFYVFMKL